MNEAQPVVIKNGKVIISPLYDGLQERVVGVDDGLPEYTNIGPKELEYLILLARDQYRATGEPQMVGFTYNLKEYWPKIKRIAYAYIRKHCGSAGHRYIKLVFDDTDHNERLPLGELDSEYATYYWCSWEAQGCHVSPIDSPPNPNILGWWSVWGETKTTRTLYALVKAINLNSVEGVVRFDWPELKGFRFCVEKKRPLVDEQVYKLEDWISSRIEKELDFIAVRKAAQYAGAYA